MRGYSWCLKSLGLVKQGEIGVSAALFLALGSSVVTTIPFSPGGLGLVDGFLIAAFKVIKHSTNGGEAVAVALLDRIISYLSIVVFGFLVYIFSKKAREALRPTSSRRAPIRRPGLASRPAALRAARWPRARRERVMRIGIRRNAGASPVRRGGAVRPRRALGAGRAWTIATAIPCSPPAGRAFAIEDTVVPDRSRWLRLPISERLATIGWQRLRAWPPPTLFARDLSLYFTPDYALPPLGGVRGILTVHDLSFLTHPECADDALRRYLSTVVPRSVREAAAVVAVSETTAAAVRAQLPGGPPIHVVPNGVDPAFNGVRVHRSGMRRTAALLDRFGLEPGYLLAVSTLEPRKNYVRLLQAFAQARGTDCQGEGRRMRVGVREEEVRCGW